MQGKRYINNSLKCKFCENIMQIDDTDYSFDGNQNNYYLCEKCHSSAFEKIRYGKSINIEWTKNNS